MRILCVCLLVLMVPLGCSTSTDTGKGNQTTGDQVSIQLNWIPDSQHGGFYAALVHGYFADEGLDVTIVPGGPSSSQVVNQVALGRVEFGVANADQILMAREQQADVVATLAAMQNSPRCIMVHEESGVESFEQLTSGKLAVGVGKAFAKFMQQELNLEKVTIVPYTGSIIPFLNDKQFAQQAYVFSEPHVAQMRDAKVRSLMVSDLGFNPYSSCLITSGDLIRNNSELVSKMTRAVKQGWIQYLNSPETTNARIQQDNPKMSVESLDFGAHEIRKLCLPEGLAEEDLGQMKLTRWQTLASQLKTLGFLKDETKLADAFWSKE